MHDLLLLFAARNIYDVGMAQSDPFEGLGAALIRLRERAGFSRQTEASEALKIDKGQLSRWENENPRPTLEDLGTTAAGCRAAGGGGVADGGQLARWGDRSPRPTLENLGRLLAGYGATVGDLAVELGVAVGRPAAAEAERRRAGGGVGGGGRGEGGRGARGGRRGWEGGARRRGCLRMRS